LKKTFIRQGLLVRKTHGFLPWPLHFAIKTARHFRFSSTEWKIQRRHISGLWFNWLLKIKTTIKIMKLTIWNKITFALGILSIAAPAFADESMAATNQPPPAPTSQQFVSDAAVGGMKEIFLSEAALDKSTDAAIKSFAGRMVKDHGAANKKLMKIAQGEGLVFPPTNTFSADDPNWSNPLISNPENLKGAQMLTMTNLPYLSDYQAVKHLQSLTGDQFDRAYLSDMVGDHIQTVNEFEAASQGLSDPELQKFAAKTLPTLKKHSMMAQELNDRHNVSKGTDPTSLPGMTATEPPM
jgi:putative membrane protein